MTKRTPEEQAELDDRLADALRLADEDRARRAAAAADFVTPKFTRSDVAAALQAREVTFQNWQARDQLDLDADSARVGTKWRLYSPRDVLRLGLAVKLSDVGFPASLFRHVMAQIDPLFSRPSPYLASNRASVIVVLPDGEVLGPMIGKYIDLAEVGAGHFVVVRLDTLLRDSLEPLGYSITDGTADDHQETLDRLKGRQG